MKKRKESKLDDDADEGRDDCQFRTWLSFDRNLSVTVRLANFAVFQKPECLGMRKLLSMMLQLQTITKSIEH